MGNGKEKKGGVDKEREEGKEAIRSTAEHFPGL
jgi:hypothetical protein